MRNTRRLTLVLMATALVIGIGVTPATADTATLDLETYATGTIDGQDGWQSDGAAGSGCAVYDHEVVDASGSGYASFGTRSLRISNGIASGCFSDQTFSKPLGDEAGESGAANGGMSGGTRQRTFTAQWDFASTVPGAEQPGLSVVASPDRGDGARMGWIQMADTPGGLEVNFFDYQDVAPFGTSGNLAQGCGAGDDFVSTNLASGLDRTVPHTIRLEMDFLDGPRNDVVRAYVDGVLEHTGTSWEDYFRYCEAHDASRTVDSVLFRTSVAAPDTEDEGFLVDNLELESSTGPVTIVVDDDGQAVPGDCDATVNSFSTIQDAENAASPGDTVQVCPGTYAERVHVTVDDLTLEGAQADVDARTRAVPLAQESLIDFAGGGLYLDADGITVDGFSVANATNTAFLGTAVYAPGSRAGLTFRNNIVRDSIFGLYLNSDGAAPTLVEHNLFKDNDEPGSANGNGIYSDQGLKDATISENRFENNFNTSILVTGTSFGPQEDIHILGNEVDNSILSILAKDVEVAGNVRIGGETTSGIVLGGGNDGVSITDNTLVATTRAIRIADFVGTPDTDVTADGNCIAASTIAGLHLTAGDYTGALNAEDNWWGADDGPSGVGPGSGDAIVDPDGVVDFDPFRDTPPAGCPVEPTIDVSDAAAVAEGNTGTTQATFDVTLSGSFPAPVSVDLDTADGTAVAPGDYAAHSETVTWPANDTTTQQVTVDVQGDKVDEFDESFDLVASNPSNAAIGDGTGSATITDDDRPARLVIQDAGQDEGDSGRTTLRFKVFLNRASEKPISADFRTEDGSATAPSDYKSKSGSLAFAPGEVQKGIQVRAKGDTAVEPDEIFTVVLSNAVNGKLKDPVAIGSIRNDD